MTESTNTMKTEMNEAPSQVQSELEELRARLKANSQVLRDSDPQGSSTELLSLVVKTTATFEKE